ATYFCARGGYFYY
nr:immunoglobulin heavy chain junction region [Mus musculus]